MAAPAPRRALGSSSVEMVVAGAVCVAAVCLVYAMLVAESAGIHHEIQLTAPEAARPGDVIAIRAYVYGTPDAAEGPTPIAPPVDVELRDGDAFVASVTLTEGAFSSQEGELAIPDDVSGTLTLVARARELDIVVATVARAITIADDAAPAAPLDRRAPTLAHFYLGPLVSDPLPPPPPPGPLDELGIPEVQEPFALDAIVPGGLCVPETECLLVVDTGSVSVIPSLTECHGVEARPERPEATITHFHALPVIVHGPEGSCDLVASRGGVQLAHRNVRLPVALATPYVDAPNALAEDGVAQLRVVAPPGRDTVIVDVFSAEGRWMRTTTFAASSDVATPTEVTLGALHPGSYLLQVRADALPTDYVLPRAFVAHASDVLTGRDEELTRPGVPRAEVLYRLAPREQHGLTLPQPSSGREADRHRLEVQKRTARNVAFGGMALAIVLLVLAVFRRGLAADAEARAVMVAAGVPGADDRSARLRGTLNVVLMVLGLGLGCVIAAAFIAAHQIVIDAPNIAASPPIEPEPIAPSGPNAPGTSSVAPPSTAP